SEHFERAKKYMPYNERMVFDSIDLILQSEQKRIYKSLSGRERIAYKRNFWVSQDPLWITEYNERKLEHYTRVAYANLRFGIKKQGVEGWKTERGQIYIKYGEPLHRLFMRPTLDVIGGQDIWDYGNFRLVFEDRYGSGKFLMTSESMLTAKGVENIHPETYTYEDEESLTSFPWESFYFKGNSGRTKIKIFYGISLKERFKDLDIWNLTIKRGIYMFDNNFNQLLKDTKIHRIEKDGSAIIRDGMAVWEMGFEIYPGNYILGLEIMENKTRKIGRIREKIDVPVFGEDSLRISDIIISRDMEIAEKGHKIFPSFDSVFRENSDLYFYYEVYNLSLDEYNSSLFEVIYEIYKRDGVKKYLSPLFSGISSLFAEKRGNPIYREIQRNLKAEENVVQYVMIDLKGYKPGNYSLRIKIIDLLSSRTAEKINNFKISG
ncbi:MAG: GWxTD domain-containing protein, partial [Fidelibacterota bacterium]